MRNTTLQDDMNALLASIKSDETHTLPPDTSTRPIHEYDVYIESGRITFIKREAPADTDTLPYVTIVSATEDLGDEKPLLNQRVSMRLARITVTFALFLMLSSLMFQLSIFLNLPTATITIIPKSRQITLSGTLQLGRVLNHITISQEATAQATGHGHQDARAATGFLTFYNGSNIAQTILAGTVYTGSDGIQIVPDETVTIPPNNPPEDGQATVRAHARSVGVNGNIAADDLNLAASRDLSVKNLAAFTGGREERDFSVVNRKDITTIAILLKPTLLASMQGALQEQLRSEEALQMVQCSPTESADHQAGEEATQVTVTLTLTCSAVLYNAHMLQHLAREMLSKQEREQLGKEYSLLGDIHITVITATTGDQTSGLATLTIKVTGIYFYHLTPGQEHHLSNLITGKSRSKALAILLTTPDIQAASIHLAGGGTTLPTDPGHIHFVTVYGAGE